MLLVEEIEPGVHELLYMWLPTWIGMNNELKKEVELYMNSSFIGREADLQELHYSVIEFFCSKFPEVRGLREYLSAVEHVHGPSESNGGYGRNGQEGCSTKPTYQQ